MLNPSKHFYSKTFWREIRRRKLAANPLCEACYPGRITRATEVDHIVAVSAGGSISDFKNLRALCKACHSRKTMYCERLGRKRVPVKGCDAQGRPLDPEHPWNKK